MDPAIASGENPSSRRGVRGRLLRGLGATALSPIIAAIIQLGSVPIFLHAWGAARYGDWLLLSAIPVYLALSDLGFGDASASDMSMRVAANDKAGALRTFQSSWVLVTVVSFSTLLLASAAVWWVPWQPWLKLSSISSLHAATILLVLAAWVVVAQQNGVAESGFRCDGNFASGTFWMSLQRLVEVSIGTTVALLGGGLLGVALTYLAVRCLSTVGYALLLRHKSPWIHYGLTHAHRQTIRRLAAPAFGFIAFPLGTSLSIQGFTIVIGALLGPVAVVSFSTLRTLSRLTIQVLGAITNTIWPEISAAFGAGDISLARSLHRHAWRASLGLSVLGGALLWVSGPLIYHLWIRDNVGFDANCFHVLLLGVTATSLLNASSVVLISVNIHFRIATIYAGATALSLALAWILIPWFGITGAAIALLFTDVWVTGLALRSALVQAQDSSGKFFPALIGLKRLRLQSTSGTLGGDEIVL